MAEGLSASVEFFAKAIGFDIATNEILKTGEAGAIAGEKISDGAQKGEKQIKSFLRSAGNMRATLENQGSSVDQMFAKFQMKNPNIDMSQFSTLYNYLKQIEQQNKVTKDAWEAQEASVKKAENAYEKLSRAIEDAIAKQKAGVTARPAEYFQQSANVQGIDLKPYEQARLNNLAGLQSAMNAEKAAQQKLAADAKEMQSKEDAFIAQLERLTTSYATAGMKASEKMSYLANRQGIDPARVQPLIDELRVLEAEYDKVNAKAAQAGSQMMKNGMTAKQYQAALRGVPAQFTDIIVSLQGGQAPLTVLLQQGGQLKDMFGGVGNAFKALGGYILGLINPFTIFGAAIGAVGVAAFQGASEQRELEKAIIATGGAAGASSVELEAMISDIGEATSQYGKAREAAMAFANTTNDFDAGMIKNAIEGIADASELTGEKVEKIAEKVSALSEDPVAAVAKLNESFKFMDKATMDTVVSLSKQGKTFEANKLILDLFAKTARDRAAEVVASAGWMERAWMAVKNAILDVWNALKGLGAASTTAQQIAETKARLASYRSRTDEGAAEDIRIAERNLQLLQGQAKAEGEKARESQKNAMYVGKAAKDYKDWTKDQKKKNKKTGSTKTNPEVTEYQNLEKSIIQKNEAVKEELLYGEKLTEAQKLRIKIENNAVDSKKKLSEAHKNHLLKLVGEYEENEKVLRQQKAYNKAIESTQKYFDKTTDGYKDRIAVLGMTDKEAKRYKDTEGFLVQKERELSDAFLSGELSLEGYQAALLDAEEKVKRLKDAHDELQKEENNPYYALRKAIKEYKEDAEDVQKGVQDLTKTTMSAMEDSLTSFFTTGKFKANDFFNAILEGLAKIAAQRMTASIFDGLLEAGGKGLSDFMGSLFGGKRAVGGPVYGGSTYLVGEHGPELFVPSQSGKVIPNNQLGNMTGTGGFNIQISHRNEGTQQQVTSSGADFDGKNLIIKIVTQDIANDGQISRTMSKTFGMRRAAGAM